MSTAELAPILEPGKTAELQIAPPLGGAAINGFNGSDENRSSFFDPPRARINGHNYFVEVTDRNAHLVHRNKKTDELEVSRTNPAIMHDMFRGFLALRTKDHIDGGNSEPWKHAFYLKDGTENGHPLYDEMYLHVIDERKSGDAVMWFSAPNFPQQSEHAQQPRLWMEPEHSQQLKLWMEIEESEIYGAELALPANWDKTPAGKQEKAKKIANLCAQLRQILRQKSS